jgi:PAP_fibrillin
LGEKGEEVIELAERLSNFSAIPNPMYGWMGFGGGSPEDCVLDGKWKLRFTSGGDATFPESQTRGKATISQVVNATEGTLTNVIDFEKGKVKGFCVVVEGRARSGSEMDLTFKKVIVQRESRFPRLLGRITFLVPSFKYLSAFARFASKGKVQSTGPGFQLRYVDQDLRMHKTRDGIWFIQTRINE